jgi:hypothetical protein
VDFGDSSLTTELLYIIITLFKILNTVALNYITKLDDNTLKGAINIIATKAKHIHISLPLNDFLLASEIMQDHKLKTYSLGILQNDNETHSPTTRVPLERIDMNTMERYQLKRLIDLIQTSPAVERSIKRLKDMLVMEELKTESAYKLIERSQAEILAKPLIAITNPNARYENMVLPTAPRQQESPHLIMKMSQMVPSCEI